METEEKTTGAQTVGAHFLRFTINFFALAKGQYHQQNVVKANTLAFNTLLTLNELNGHDLTMSELAEELDITKQQLTKLVNDLEEKGLVKREHDSRNRRQVYLYITPTGAAIVSQLKEAMLSCTVAGLAGYSEEELAELDNCLLKLSGLLSRFNPDAPGAVKCPEFPSL